MIWIDSEVDKRKNWGEKVSFWRRDSQVKESILFLKSLSLSLSLFLVPQKDNNVDSLNENKKGENNNNDNNNNNNNNKLFRNNNNA